MAQRERKRGTEGPDAEPDARAPRHADLADLRVAPFWLTASQSSDGREYYAVYLGDPVLDPAGRAWAAGRHGRRLMLFLDDDIPVLRLMCERGDVEMPQPGQATPVSIAVSRWTDERE